MDTQSCPHSVLRPGLPDLPSRMKKLPIDKRGFSVPYFVAWSHGVPEALPRLSNAASIIHRGIEWEQPFVEDKYLSATPKDGFRLGLAKAERNLLCFQAPSPIYLSARPEHRRKRAPGAFNLPWHSPKVIMNAAMGARGFWCIAAFADDAGLMCSQSFYGIWPKGDWSTTALAAVLNGPVACAFIAAHEGDQLHIRKETLQRVPLPQIDSSEIKRIDLVVDQYLQAVAANTMGMFYDPDLDRARKLLLEIDALVLKGYHLQPRLERELLDYFRGATRHVPFSFTEYFPADLDVFVPLHEFISNEYARSLLGRFRQQHKPVSSPEVLSALRHAVEAFSEE